MLNQGFWSMIDRHQLAMVAGYPPFLFVVIHQLVLKIEFLVAIKCQTEVVGSMAKNGGGG